MTLVGLITEGDETRYRSEVDLLTTWCRDNNLLLNVNKTKENVVDFRKGQAKHQPLIIDSAVVERAVLSTFSRGTIESVLSSCIAVWGGSCTDQNLKALQRIVNTAGKIIGASLPSLKDIYTSHLTRKATTIVSDVSHPARSLFDLLPSGKRYRSLRSRTTRLANSFALWKALQANEDQDKQTQNQFLSQSHRRPQLQPALMTLSSMHYPHYCFLLFIYFPISLRTGTRGGILLLFCYYLTCTLSTSHALNGGLQFHCTM
nr:uncharacterized protein LOC125989380 [Syngnathus scovelli]